MRKAVPRQHRLIVSVLRPLPASLRSPSLAGAKDFETYARAWEATVLALIGEQIDPDNFINGVYLQVRNPRLRELCCWRISGSASGTR